MAGCDFSRETLPATEYAAGLAREFSATLHLFHAVESPHRRNRRGFDPGPLWRGPADPARATVSPSEPPGVNGRGRAGGAQNRVGTRTAPPSSCRHMLPARKADILVVGVRRHHKLEKLMVGSTTEAVAAPFPLPGPGGTVVLKRRPARCKKQGVVRDLRFLNHLTRSEPSGTAPTAGNPVRHARRAGYDRHI